MTSKWPVEDESGNISTFTMVMNLDSTGITEILRFNSKESEDEGYILLSEEDKKLIKK
ncbi:hypothetical protein [Wolbachia endosymbiont of Tettigetta isshikii]|uniref:hypothetical protein n=1 Tax=Wolbachia endosymbiont of Tettigetta isshikii TaxID=3239093 RepID=UPI003981654C